MSQTELPQPAPGTGRRFFFADRARACAALAFRIAIAAAHEALLWCARGMSLANSQRAPFRRHAEILLQENS
jgi:hypothetical protein